MSRSMMPNYKCFGGVNHPFLQGRKVCYIKNVRVERGLSLYPEDRGSMLLRKADASLPDRTTSIIRSHLHSQLTWELYHLTFPLLEMDHKKLITIKTITKRKSCPRKSKSNRPISKYKCNHFTEHTLHNITNSQVQIQNLATIPSVVLHTISREGSTYVFSPSYHTLQIVWAKEAMSGLIPDRGEKTV